MMILHHRASARMHAIGPAILPLLGERAGVRASLKLKTQNSAFKIPALAAQTGMGGTGYQPVAAGNLPAASSSLDCGDPATAGRGHVHALQRTANAFKIQASFKSIQGYSRPRKPIQAIPREKNISSKTPPISSNEQPSQYRNLFSKANLPQFIPYVRHKIPSKNC
jgi:hypothetical protein